MKVNIDEMPEDKTFDDYPEDTEFVFKEKSPRFDREALKDNKIVRIFYGQPGYENAVTREEAISGKF